ncbi:amidase domain-containing protein [Halobacillus yeomjeoni]|uniref:Amidase domain-containing protein n=1 Tax=Halobacillus yeomjeoni TaxID=311194 RepID=A0A931HR01_9BACI|nr:amidase domain-containing protein [Halobacillus yeomjeoni]MBH0228605.1 amidase domain-containing protein [Halobacillus yeomjeoni]
MSHTHQLQLYWEKVAHHLLDQDQETWLQRKVKGMEERGERIMRVTFRIHPYHRMAYERHTSYRYLLSLSILIQNGRHYYLEEGVHEGSATFLKDKMLGHRVTTETICPPEEVGFSEYVYREDERIPSFSYDRREAVRYAERWWDDANPAYPQFENDCTNFVSQCLRAGGLPTWGVPHQTRGWWYQNGKWSYSWSVAHAFKWYLSGSTKGQVAKEVFSADQLSPGDIICYDFQGNDRFDHNTIVVKLNKDGMPLVNAHTTNSRHRYWDYKDSTAYTPDIEYKFYTIGG